MNNMKSNSNVFRIEGAGSVKYVRVTAILSIGRKTVVFATDGWDKDWSPVWLGNPDERQRPGKLTALGVLVYRADMDAMAYMFCGCPVFPLSEEEASTLARISTEIKLERGRLYMTKYNSLVRFAGKSRTSTAVSEIFKAGAYNKIASKEEAQALGFPAHEAADYVGCIPFEGDLGLRDLSLIERNACMMLNIPLVKK